MQLLKLWKNMQTNLNLNDMEYYRKVFIKSEEDLPKEDGIVIVKDTTNANPHYFIYNKGCRDFWLTNIDWYLQPIELSADEGIEKQFPIDYDKFKVNKNTFNLGEREGAKWMRDKFKDK